jgi:protein-disulfide isomerase-like protein with CxxC motif
LEQRLDKKKTVWLIDEKLRAEKMEETPERSKTAGCERENTRSRLQQEELQQFPQLLLQEDHHFLSLTDHSIEEC